MPDRGLGFQKFMDDFKPDWLFDHENTAYARRQPEHLAMELASGIAIDRTGHSIFSRGVLVWTDAEGRPIVEWLCDHQHADDDRAHECARQKWIQHHG